MLSTSFRQGSLKAASNLDYVSDFMCQTCDLFNHYNNYFERDTLLLHKGRKQRPKNLRHTSMTVLKLKCDAIIFFVYFYFVNYLI